MFFAWDITVDAGTEEDDPKIEVLKLTKGTLTRIGIKFPKGCHGLVKTKLLHHESQLFPLNLDEWVIGNGEEVSGVYDFDLDAAPFTLKFIGCAPETVYSHKVTVRVTVIRKKVEPATKLASTLERFLKHIGVR